MFSRNRFFAAAVFAALASVNIFAQCPSEGSIDPNGSRTSPLTHEEKAFNKKKNKSARVPSSAPEVISINELKSGRTRKDDRDWWWEGAYVEINDAYLIDFKLQGNEQCNCYEGDDDETMADIHINLGNLRDTRDKDNNFYVVVEITPDYKKRHQNVRQKLEALKGKKVIVRGYLFYDGEHERNSVNYCESCSDNGVWRKTCWEVHPVTFIGLAQ